MTAVVLGLRLGRWGVVGFSALAFFSSLVQALAFFQLAGRTPAEHAAFGKSMTQLASSLTLVLPPPMRLDTVGGYVEWRSFGGLAIVFAVWALISASGAARGDEERGLVEVALAASLTRFGWMASRFTGFAAASFVAAAFGGLGLVVGAMTGGESVSLRAVLEQSVALAALALSCYALTLLVGQLAGVRIATASAGVLLVALFLVNTLSRTFTALTSVRWLSPFHYYELNHPLVPEDGLDVRATAVMLLIGLIAGGAAAVAFASRDLGSPLLRLPLPSEPTTYHGSLNPVWRIPVLRGIYERRLGLLVWAAGIAFLGAVFVSLTKTIIQPLMSIPALTQFFGGFVQGRLYTSFLGFFWLSTAELLFAAFAIAQVARWSAEDSDGRLEVVLSQPQSRATVVVERASVLAVGAAVIAAVSGVVVTIASHNQGMDVSGERLAEGSLLLVPFALVFAAAGSVLAAWNPRAAVGLLGAFAFVSYVLAELGPLLKWPAWLQDFSAFKLFGTPLSSGIDRTGLLTMIAIIIVGFGASILLMERRDVGA
jgi:polyether ionophore transport system permease protein